MQWKWENFCGDEDGYEGFAHYGIASDQDCNSKCAGNNMEVCGGDQKISVYRTCEYYEPFDVILITLAKI